MKPVKMINAKTLIKNLTGSKKEKLDPVIALLSVNLPLVFFQLIYLNLRFKYLNRLIPLWYTKSWGEMQLAPRNNIFVIPIATLIIITLGCLLLLSINRRSLKFGHVIIFLSTTLPNVLLTYSVLRIIGIASTPFKPLINPTYLSLFAPFAVAFLIVYFVTPRFIRFAQSKDIVTDPSNHMHPAMILVKPSARGGGFVFSLGLLAATAIFVQISKEIAGILLVAALLALLGLIDDYQNTHPKSKFNFLEKPLLRLLALFIVVFIVTLFGIRVESISNPFNGILQLGTPSFILGGLEIEPLIIGFTVFWIVWILNFLSWSNGVDGQYCGIIGIVGIVIAILALRFDPLRNIHRNYARFAVIIAGASFGLTRYTWHPSKIMWGFGAISAGLAVAALSILINSKIATSIIILLIPFLDASVTIARRVIQGRNPLKGDKGHLHHVLLARGWSVPKIALFYWVTTAIFGALGIISADKLMLQTALIFVGFGAFSIVLLNLRLLRKKQKPQGSE